MAASELLINREDAIAQARCHNHDEIIKIRDELEIQRLITRYCYIVDRKNWDSFPSLFTDNAYIDYTANFGGDKGNVKDIVRFLKNSVGIYFGVTVHRVSNFDITFPDDTDIDDTAIVDGHHDGYCDGNKKAFVRSKLHNPMYIRFFPVFPIISLEGYYLHEMIKVPVLINADGKWKENGCQWKIKKLSEEIDVGAEWQILILLIFLIAIYKLFTSIRKLLHASPLTHLPSSDKVRND